MGAVKEEMENQVCWAARQTGQAEDEILDRWNRELRERPEQMESIVDFVNRTRKKHIYRK